jgi:hypothetical protein
MENAINGRMDHVHPGCNFDCLILSVNDCLWGIGVGTGEASRPLSEQGLP